MFDHVCSGSPVDRCLHHKSTGIELRSRPCYAVAIYLDHEKIAAAFSGFRPTPLSQDLTA